MHNLQDLSLFLFCGMNILLTSVCPYACLSISELPLTLLPSLRSPRHPDPLCWKHA